MKVLKEEMKWTKEERNNTNEDGEKDERGDGELVASKTMTGGSAVRPIVVVMPKRNSLHLQHITSYQNRFISCERSVMADSVVHRNASW